VSTLDFANGVTLQGFRIPALSTRRAETELELMNGQTFAIAGLLDNTVSTTMQKIPGIGDIPILGELFKSRQAQKDKTELVVMITPEILPRNSPGVTSDMPRMPETFLPALPDKKTHPLPPPAFGGKVGSGAASAAPSPAPTATPNLAPLPSKDPTAAAAAVSALTPAAPPVSHENVGPAKPADPTPTVATPAATATTTPDAPAAAAPARPLSAKEQQMLARAHKLELEQQEAAAHAKAEQDKRAAKLEAQQAAENRKKDKIEQERQAKLAKEQAERDKEEAKKQAEIDKKQQKTIAEAAAKLKAAQDAYQAELAKKSAAKDR